MTSLTDERSSPRTPESRLSSFREITPLDIIPETLDEGDEELAAESKFEDILEEDHYHDNIESLRATSFNTSMSTIVSHPEDILLPGPGQTMDYIEAIDHETFLVTEGENQEWDRQMETQKELVKKYSEDYAKWEEKMSQRQVIAFGRLKNLNRFHHQRMHFYELFKDYVKSAETKLKNQTDSYKTSTKVTKDKSVK